MCLVFSWKSETERKERGGVKQHRKSCKITKKKFEKYHVPDSPDPRARESCASRGD